MNALDALKQWEQDTEKPASASEGNAFMDGYQAAAAQLAEKEREIAAFVHLWTAAQRYYASPSGSHADEYASRKELGVALKQTDPSDTALTIYDKLIYPLESRAEAAEQRLQEAQAEIKRLHKLFGDLTPGGSEFAGDPDYCASYLRDRANTQTDLLKKKFIELRQREAELEQLRA